MKIEKSGMENKIFCCTDCTVVEGWTVIKKKCGSRNRFSLYLYYLKSEGGGYSSVAAYSRKIIIVEWYISYSMVREEILLIAFFYSRSFWAPKHFKQLVKYPHVLYFKPAKIGYPCILWYT